MFIVKNVLSQKDRKYLTNLIDKEIKNHVCIDDRAALYQSHNNMHKKFEKDATLTKLSKIVTKQASKFYPKKYEVYTEWFNVCKEDSKFVFHQHNEAPLAAVYYLKDCEGNGTIFNINNDVQFQVLIEDNSILYFNPLMPHTIPVWAGKDRYSVAFDLIEQPTKKG